MSEYGEEERFLRNMHRGRGGEGERDENYSFDRSARYIFKGIKARSLLLMLLLRLATAGTPGTISLIFLYSLSLSLSLSRFAVCAEWQLILLICFLNVRVRI